MRISSTLFFRTGLDAINTQQADLRHLYQQTGSGKRMVTPADDPLAAAQSIKLGQSQAMNQRYADNRQLIKQNLSAEDSTLSAVVRALQDVKTQLIGTGNGVLSDADRKSLAAVLESAKSQVLTLANATDGNGQYLFSGHQQVQGAPFDPQGQWTAGLAGQRMIQVDQTRQLAGSDLGSDIFARMPDSKASYFTSAAVGNSGTATIGAPAVIDPNHASVGNTFTLKFTSATQFEVDDGTTVTTHTYDPEQGEIQLHGCVRVTLSGTPQEGDAFSVTPATALDTDASNMFASFDTIIAALKEDTAGNPAAAARLRNAITTAIQRFDAHYDNVLTVQASVGARLSEVDAIDVNGAALQLGYTQQLSQLEDLNYYEATTQLQLRTAALEAAALAFRKIQTASFMYLHNGG